MFSNEPNRNVYCAVTPHGVADHSDNPVVEQDDILVRTEGYFPFVYQLIEGAVDGSQVISDFLCDSVP